MSKKRNANRRIRKAQEDAKQHIPSKEVENIHYNSFWGYPMYSKENILAKIKQYTVMSQYGSYEASFTDEEDAVAHVKILVRSEPTKRYIVLETLKEIGATTPEVEVNEFKKVKQISKDD